MRNLLSRVTLGALEARDVSQVDWMFEWLIGFVATLAFAIREGAQVNGMFEGSGLEILFRRRHRIVDHCVANIAIVANQFARVADMLAIVASEASRKIKMADIIRMRLPVSLHFRKKIVLKDTL